MQTEMTLYCQSDRSWRKKLEEVFVEAPFYLPMAVVGGSLGADFVVNSEMGERLDFTGSEYQVASFGIVGVAFELIPHPRPGIPV